jgi:hypothetical protein
MPRPVQPNNKNKKPKISNLEWGIAIGILFVVDLIQLGLDFLFEVGVIINRFIDIWIGMSWSLYLKLRGINMNAPKIFSIILTFFLEEIPDVDALPLWTADGIIMYMAEKAEEKLGEGKAGELGNVALGIAAIAAAPETGGASLAAAGAAETAAVSEAATSAEGAMSRGVQGARPNVGDGVRRPNGSVPPNSSSERPDFGDDYADAMGRESDKGHEAEPSPEESMGYGEGQGDEDYQTPNEEADELGRQSNNQMEDKNDRAQEEDTARNEVARKVREGKTLTGEATPPSAAEGKEWGSRRNREEDSEIKEKMIPQAHLVLIPMTKKAIS